SLFVDTMRTLRVLALAHRLGHVLAEEGDTRVSLLERLLQHASATCRYAVYYGEGPDPHHVRGRRAHANPFNLTDGRYRCPGTQQGYSPFTTWTRGLAWMLLGAAEEAEFLATVDDAALAAQGGRDGALDMLLRAAEATADYYIATTPVDGVPYWD